MDLEYFRDNICNTCKNKCEPIIVIEKDSNTETIKCFNYEKDDTKIKGYIKPLETTAKLKKMFDAKII